jgi:WSC domain
MKLLGLVLLVFGLALHGTCMAMNQAVTSTLEARSDWTFLGCYTDNVSGRALPNGEAVAGGTNAMTNVLCQSTCLAAGFSIAGTEYAGECCKFPLQDVKCWMF